MPDAVAAFVDDTHIGHTATHVYGSPLLRKKTFIVKFSYIFYIFSKRYCFLLCNNPNFLFYFVSSFKKRNWGILFLLNLLTINRKCPKPFLHQKLIFYFVFLQFCLFSQYTKILLIPNNNFGSCFYVQFTNTFSVPIIIFG
jgi:hypothetical protein